MLCEREQISLRVQAYKAVQILQSKKGHYGEIYIIGLGKINPFHQKFFLVIGVSSKFELPELRNPDEIHIKNQVEAIWNRWGKQGKDFLDTSLNCLDEGNYNLAVFLMHKAVESTLSAIIRVNLGYRLSIHNLARQLRITLIFTDDLKNVFDFSVIEDVQLFELLQTAYSAARYKDDFKAGKDVVQA